jgi:hypothetical protein
MAFWGCPNLAGRIMPIEILEKQYEVLTRLTGGERLLPVPGKILAHEFVHGNARTPADSAAVSALLQHGILRISQDRELVFDGNLADFSIKKFKRPRPKPSGKSNRKR